MNHQYFFIIALFLGSMFPALSGQNAKIDPSVLHEAEQGMEVDIIAILEEQADVSTAYQIKGKTEKGAFVFQTLSQLAKRTQKRAVQLLKDSGRPFDAYYIVNAVHAKVDLSLLLQLAALPEVARIQPNPVFFNPLPQEQPPASLSFRNSIEWGLSTIGADAVWEMGYLGQGVVIAGQDTGYEWDHPSLISQYRGWNGNEADHNYNWHDAIHEVSPVHGDTSRTAEDNRCGLDSAVPCDDHNHGTHTMGTMLGDDGQNNQIGVAPQAKWIGCRNMEAGYGSPATYIECFEWFLAPTDLKGEDPDPALAPHVINNSWSCPEMEGCTPDNWGIMERVVANLKAAGIVVVVSTGNSGRAGCGTVNAPAAMFAGSFSVGATAENDSIAAFSSRGPVEVDGSGRMKPDIVAPGVSVRSSIRGGRYASYSGTSMAGPHVAGLVAMIISANPGLAGEVEQIEDIIRQTAVPKTTEENCGGVSGIEVPNNTYGYGRIDAVAAVEKALITTTNAEVATETGIRVFPNPARHVLHIHSDRWEGPARLIFYNSIGQVLLEKEWFFSKGSIETIDLSRLPDGLIFYRLTGADNRAGGQLIKQAFD